MGEDAWPIWPSVAGFVDHSDSGVSAEAVRFFIGSGDKKALLYALSIRQKEKLLPLFRRALLDHFMILRRNAAIALRYYPEYRLIVVPSLLVPLSDSSPYVRLEATRSLNMVDAVGASRAGAVKAVIEVLKNDRSIGAMEAVYALGEFQTETKVAVTALIEALQSTNILVPGAAHKTLMEKFSADVITPELIKAIERHNGTSQKATAILRQLELSRPATE
ncbi:MAG TPA: hypothetical protein EYG38_21570 [Verrucomicrobia bacterium]|nr:hypothetical protein [Verrucomicrobiota bacterium]